MATASETPTTDAGPVKRRWFDRFAGAGSSIIVHALIIAGLVFLTYDIPVAPKTQTFEAALPEEEVVITDLPDNIEVTDVAGTVGTSTSVDLASSAAGMMESASSAAASSSADIAPITRLDMEAPSRPLASAPADIGLTEVVPGLMGQTVDAGGVEGSVDRITREIIRQLSQGPVLVVWIMDSTQSLKENREKVIERFDRVNSQLTELGKMKEDLLLNAVVSFGQGVDFVTDKPVAEPAALQSAVRSITEDGSGEEKIFSAIREAAQKYRRYQTQGKRTVMMIVVTDEIGDDLAAIDDCVQVVRRNKIPVYILGPPPPLAERLSMFSGRTNRRARSSPSPSTPAPNRSFPSTYLCRSGVGPSWTIASPPASVHTASVF